jgi:hypothetical protein
MVRFDNHRMVEFARKAGAELIRRPGDDGLLTVRQRLH